MNIAVVNCFGLFDEAAREPEEIRGLEEYFSGIAIQLADLYKMKELDCVVLSGGYRVVNQVSEAESSLEFFEDELAENEAEYLPVLLQTTGNNMVSNLALGYLTALETFKPEKVWFCVDSVRLERAKNIVDTMFEGSGVEVVVLHSSRQDINEESNPEIQAKKIKDDQKDIKLWKDLIQSR